MEWATIISFILGLVIAYIFFGCCDGRCVVIKSDQPVKKKTFCFMGDCDKEETNN